MQRFITDSFILLNKKVDYNIFNYNKKFIFIHNNNDNFNDNNFNEGQNKNYNTPCLFLRNIKDSNFFIYFYGNSENIFDFENNGLYSKTNFNINIIIVEYPIY